MRTLTVSLILLLLLLFAGRLRSTTGSEFEKGILTVSGRDRTFLVHWPEGKKHAQNLPVVLILHGGGGAGEGMAGITGFNKKADEEGFLAIYPNGSGRFETRLLTWNSGNCCAYAQAHGIDDVKFVDALIEKAKKDYHADPNRIFVTGHSNGGMMTYRLACELADKIAAAAPVSGAMNVSCKPARPVSMLMIHGTADEHVLYYGGKGKKQLDAGRFDQPVADSVAFWIQHNGCSAVARKKEKGHVIEETYSKCKAAAEVTLITLKEEGHTWPGGVKWSAWADEPSRELSATDRIWEFFENHPRIQ